MCIVVVEDEADVQAILRAVLEDEGYRVRTFGHPGPVTQLGEEDEHPDLFLIDIMLPAMSGIELAQRLQHAGFEATPKVAMSASQEYLAQASRSQLFDETMRKPFEIDQLLACVGHYTHAGAPGHVH